MSEGGGAERESLGRRRELFGAVASIFLLLVALALAIVGGKDGEAAPVQEGPRVVDATEVEDLEATLGHPVYWAGPSGRDDLELTVEADGSVYLRYLPRETKPGNPRQEFLTVGTYPVADAQAALQRTAEANGTQLMRLDDGSIVLPNPASAGSVYLAHPDSDLEIEVYDPKSGQALQLIRAKAIEPVGE
jgi:hypothetical protein